MARRIGKKRIKIHLESFKPYREKLEDRIRKISVDGASAIIIAMLDDAEERILSGDPYLWSTKALIRSTVRIIENCESGYYKSVTADGGFVLS